MHNLSRFHKIRDCTSALSLLLLLLLLLDVMPLWESGRLPLATQEGRVRKF